MFGAQDPQRTAAGQIPTISNLPPGDTYDSAKNSLLPMYENPSSAVPKAPSAPPAPGLHARSCNTCRRRKVKCDKIITGCSNCAKAHIECIYPSPGRAPRRMKTTKAPSARETELLKRLRRLEGVVEELSGAVEVEAAKSSPSSQKEVKDDNSEHSSGKGSGNVVRVVGMDEGNANSKMWLKRMLSIGDGPPPHDVMHREFGKLVIDEGKSHYISSAFWAALNNEVEDVRDLLDEYEDTEDEDENNPVDFLNEAGSPHDHQSFIMGYSSSKVDLRSLHPLPSQIPFYWQTFVENVDPLTKIMHVPTMAKTIKEVKDNLDSLSKSLEALLFSIYFSVIVSMTPEEVMTNFGMEKTFLLTRYRFGTEQALARANFLSTSEIVTVQAFVLFLVCVRRHDDSRFVWSLTGLAIRLGLGLGLHRDGEKLGLSPFDTEMRRRLWWQLCILDVRCSEDYGSDPSIREDSFDTQLPTNVNDADFDPSSTERPEPRSGVSEMTFCLIRYEICNTSRRLAYEPPGDSPCGNASRTQSIEDKERLVRTLHERLEERYLQHCIDAGPLFWVAATVARLIVAKMSLIVFFRGPGPGVADELSQQLKDRLFVAAIEIMEYSRLLETENKIRKWGWLFHTYVQWHAIAFILREVSVRPYDALVERAWRAVDVVFKDWGEAVKHSKSQKNGMLWAPMRKLMAKARKKREEDMKSMSTYDASSGEVLRGLLDVKVPSFPSGNVSLDGSSDDQGPVRPLRQGLPMDNRFQPPIPAVDLSQRSLDNMMALQGQGQMPNQQQIRMPSSLESQFQQYGVPPQSTPWLLDDSALVDLDMNAVDENVSWEGWDALVRDFQMDVDSTAQDQRGPVMSAMGTWW